MFQDYALFPHRDVGDNVAFGLRMRGDGAAARDARVAELLALVGLDGAERRAVSTLSGGERQRVALARALAPSPTLLMLDEPLGALDRTLRDRLVVELGGLFAELGIGVLYVTHDQGEALGLGHRVVVMDAGRAAQVGSPAELWAAPATPFVARFLGFTNLVDVEVAGGVARVAWGSVPVTGVEDGPHVLLVRPEAVAVAAGAAGEAMATAVVGDVVFQGGQWRVELQLEGLVLETTVPGGRGGSVTPPLTVGTTVTLSVDPVGVQALGS
jgi:thiamine transport system ATP-binding protein